MKKSYSQMLTKCNTFAERYDYLKFPHGDRDEINFEESRTIKQRFYQSREWKRIRKMVIARDHGCDLGIPDRPIGTFIVVHHINKVTTSDLLTSSEMALDPNNLICTSTRTHDSLHLGLPLMGDFEIITRTPGDTKSW